MPLKVISTVILSLLLTGYSGWSQKHPQFRYVSFDAGLNMSGIRSAHEYQKNPGCFGVRAGMSGNYSFSDARSVGFSLLFNQKGAREHIPQIKTNLNYLSLPVFYLYKTGRDPGFFFLGGAYGSYLLNAGRRGELSTGEQQSKIRETVTSEFKSYDYGVILGLGMMIRLYDDFDFKVAIQGSAGLPVIKNMEGSNPRNYNINLSLGYIYYLGFR